MTSGQRELQLRWQTKWPPFTAMLHMCSWRGKLVSLYQYLAIERIVPFNIVTPHPPIFNTLPQLQQWKHSEKRFRHRCAKKNPTTTIFKNDYFNLCHLALGFILAGSAAVVLPGSRSSKWDYRPGKRIWPIIDAFWENDQIIHIHVSKSLANISALASHLPRPVDASFKDLWRGFTVSSSLASRLSGIPWDISRGASAYLNSYFGASLLVLRSGAIRESEKNQWSYNDRNGYEHLHPPAEESKHQRE